MKVKVLDGQQRGSMIYSDGHSGFPAPYQRSGCLVELQAVRMVAIAESCCDTVETLIGEGSKITTG